MQPTPLYLTISIANRTKQERRHSNFPLLSIRKHHFNRLERNKFTCSYAFNFLRSPATGIITHRQNWLCQGDHHRIKIDRQCSPKPLHLTTISIPNRSKEQERRKFEFPSLCIRKITPTNLQKSIHTYQYAFKFLRSTPTENITHRQNWLCQRDQHRNSSLTNNAPPILHNLLFFFKSENFNDIKASSMIRNSTSDMVKFHSLPPSVLLQKVSAM